MSETNNIIKELDNFEAWKLWCDDEGYWCELTTDNGVVTEFGINPQSAVAKAVGTASEKWQAAWEARRNAKETAC